MGRAERLAVPPNLHSKGCASLQESNNSRPVTGPNGDAILAAFCRRGSGPSSKVIGQHPGPYARTSRILSGEPLLRLSRPFQRFTVGI